MKVWLVYYFWENYENEPTLVGVFSTPEKAVKFVDEQYSLNYNIVEVVVDELENK